jgi:hypothetical protein
MTPNPEFPMPTLRIALSCLCFSLLLACSEAAPSCLDICEAAQAQDCTNIQNCKSECTDSAALARKSGCEDQRSAYLDCADAVATCSIDDSCGAEVRAFAACTLPYCALNPTEPYCQ